MGYLNCVFDQSLSSIERIYFIILVVFLPMLVSGVIGFIGGYIAGKAKKEVSQ